MSQKKALRFQVVSRYAGFPVIGEVRGFRVTIDEEESFGGKNSGPNPVEYLLLALASCISITLKMVAQKKKLDIKNVIAEAQSDFDLEAFQRGEPVSLKEISLTVKVDSDENTDTLEKLLEEAERRCTVSNTLSAKVKARILKTKA